MGPKQPDADCADNPIEYAMDVQFQRMLQSRIERAFARLVQRPRLLDVVIDEALLEALRGLVRRQVDVAVERMSRNGPGFRGGPRR